ncbi:MAG: flagellar export chaperone FliS [Massilia sp.]
MFGTNRTGVSAYANVGIETGVAAADPHKLIVMLFDGACVAIRSAIVQMQAGDIAAKGAAISKAITIIENGLRASLDQKAGGDIAASLEALYEYMGGRLLQANLQNDVGMLEEVHRLLSDLRGAWNAIRQPAPQDAAQPKVA